MGTSNFARGNTSRVFAVLMDEQDDVEDFIDDIREVADNSRPFGIQYSKENGRDRNASNLFSYRMSKWYGDLEVELQIVAKMVSGYYEGASFLYLNISVLAIRNPRGNCCSRKFSI